jgi:hypothetical protein
MMCACFPYNSRKSRLLSMYTSLMKFGLGTNLQSRNLTFSLPILWTPSFALVDHLPWPSRRQVHPDISLSPFDRAVPERLNRTRPICNVKASQEKDPLLFTLTVTLSVFSVFLNLNFCPNDNNFKTERECIIQESN